MRTTSYKKITEDINFQTKDSKAFLICSVFLLQGAPSTNNTPNKLIPSTGEFENTPPTLVMSQRMIISASPAPTSMLSRSSSRAGNGRLSRSATVSSAKFGTYHYLLSIVKKLCSC